MVGCLLIVVFDEHDEECRFNPSLDCNFVFVFVLTVCFDFGFGLCCLGLGFDRIDTDLSTQTCLS